MIEEASLTMTMFESPTLEITDSEPIHSLLSTVKDEYWVGKQIPSQTEITSVQGTKYTGFVPRFCIVINVQFPENVITEFATVTVFTAWDIILCD